MDEYNLSIPAPSVEKWRAFENLSCSHFLVAARGRYSITHFVPWSLGPSVRRLVRPHIAYNGVFSAQLGPIDLKPGGNLQVDLLFLLHSSSFSSSTSYSSYSSSNSNYSHDLNCVPFFLNFPYVFLNFPKRRRRRRRMKRGGFFHMISLR